jgi:uncharacterized protein YcbK (DUF882 family)
MQISEHLTLEELTRSQTAIRKRINNKAPMHVIENLKLLAEKIFEPTRKHFGKPIRISSGYRSVALNREIGGSKNSQHIQGQAIDIQGTNGLTNLEIFNYIKDNLIFDQLINEYPNSKGEPSWVHVSYSRLRNRKMVLTIGKM